MLGGAEAPGSTFDDDADRASTHVPTPLAGLTLDFPAGREYTGKIEKPPVKISEAASLPDTCACRGTLFRRLLREALTIFPTPASDRNERPEMPGRSQFAAEHTPRSCRQDGDCEGGGVP